MNLPVVALKNIVVMPGMMMNFDVARKAGIAAIEKAMKGNSSVLLISQRNANEELPGLEDLYSIGTVAHIKQMLRLPGNIIRVIAVGEQRARLISLTETQPFMNGEVEELEEREVDFSEAEEEAMIRSLREMLEIYSKVNNRLNKAAYKQLSLVDSIEKLLGQIAVQIPMSISEKQSILETSDLFGRYQRIAVILSEEVEIMQIKKELQEKVQAKVDRNQREYIMREQMKVLHEELGDADTASEADRYREDAEKINAPRQVKDKIIREIGRFRNLTGSSAESAVCRGYIETLLALPWDRAGQDKPDLVRAERILNRDHYGLEKVKDRILEFLAVRGLTQKGESPIICLVGPPGTGKTSIARSIAVALNKEYVRICLGGVRDEAEIRGHRRTYVGAMPGRIIMGLKSAGVKNPLMLLDEIDKAGSDHKGDTASALLEVLDSEQNSKFVDHYIELPVDLSEVLFIATANSTQNIPRPLLDRMELIEVNSYTQNEKYHIAREHLVAKQLKKNGLKSTQLSFSTKALQTMITGYTREAGVRNLERRIGEVCRKVAREIFKQEENNLGRRKRTPGISGEGQSSGTVNKPVKITVTDRNLEQYLGKIKYSQDKAKQKPEVGVVFGLAWTGIGGDTLEVEVNTMPGKGNFELTGQMGDVMKESAKTGISYIRSVSKRYDIDSKFFEENDIHIHIPEGAVPKDGPSAGITMATAMLSAVTGKKLRADIAMTGEITLRGRVLPVGGLKEKLLAARTAGIKLVVVPEKNRADIEELSSEITGGMDIKYAADMEEVLEYALYKNQ